MAHWQVGKKKMSFDFTFREFNARADLPDVWEVFFPQETKWNISQQSRLIFPISCDLFKSPLLWSNPLLQFFRVTERVKSSTAVADSELRVAASDEATCGSWDCTEKKVDEFWQALQVPNFYEETQQLLVATYLEGCGLEAGARCHTSEKGRNLLVLYPVASALYVPPLSICALVQISKLAPGTAVHRCMSLVTCPFPPEWSVLQAVNDTRWTLVVLPQQHLFFWAYFDHCFWIPLTISSTEWVNIVLPTEAL